MLKGRSKNLYDNFKHFSKVLRTYTLKKYNLIEIIILWSKRHLNRFQFLVLSGIIVGFLGGGAGIILKTVVHYIQVYTVGNISTIQRIIAYGTLPILGILLTTLVARYLYKKKENIELQNVLVDIAQHGSNINKQEIHSRVVQSAITVGFGGSAGLETPMAITGAAIGSNFGKRYRLGYKEKTLLLAGGAAAGIAAAFNAPIAGIMFSFEMLLTGVVFSDFIPLVISALCGSILTRMVLSNEILFSLSSRTPFNFSNIIYYILLGIVAGFYARYYILASKKVKHLLERFPYGSIKRALIGGVILASLCVAFPALYGEGYINIKMLHQGNIQHLFYQNIIDFFDYPKIVILIMLLLTTFFKAFATSATLNSGGVGGNFAPSLIAGGLLGYTFGYALILMGFENTPITNLMLVGMAGVLSGVLYAPLTAIFLIAESSSGYDLFIPLMIVAVISFLINKYFSPINPAYSKLVDEGKIFTMHQDQNLLSQIQFVECLDKDSIKVANTAKFSEILDLFNNSNKSVVAVVDENNRFWGMIHKEALTKRQSFEEGIEDKVASEISIHPSNLVYTDEGIESVIRKFEESDTWYLPLIDKDHQYFGFVSRFQILKKYRQLLKGYS